MSCPWCKNPFAPEEFKHHKSCKEFDRELRENKMKIRDDVERLKQEVYANKDNHAEKHSGRHRSADAGGMTKQMKKKKDKLDPRCTGRLAPVACNVFMNVFYAGRYARCGTCACSTLHLVQVHCTPRV